MNCFMTGATSTVGLSVRRFLLDEATVDNLLTLQMEHMGSSAGAER